MAANKDKLLVSAQKNLKKKQVAKAIKDYLKIVNIDPADVRSRQKLAELYVRVNKKAEAYEQYESVAKYFSSNGFYLKAIAIYKQMQRLDPSQIAIFNRLAELNEKQGLLGNAIAEYRNLVEYYGRNGLLADEIKTLEKMRELDPDNLNIRIKLAEIYAKNGRENEGLNELEDVLDVLAEKGAFDKILKLYKLFLPLYPNNKKMQMKLALVFYEKGDYDHGVTIIENLLKDSPEDPDLLRLLGRGYIAVDSWPNAREAYLQLLSKDPTDLDIREALIKCELGDGRYDQALDELEEWKDTFLKADRLSLLREFYETLKEKLNDNAVVLETLDSIYELTGEGDKLLDIISAKDEEADEPVVEEMLSDSLLDSVETDTELSAFEVEHSADDMLELGVFEDESLDLQLEPSDGNFVESASGADSFIELEIDNNLDLGQEKNAGHDFSFDLSEDKTTVPDGSITRDPKADLEEAEFYLQQGLYTEADKLCRGVLAYAPDSEECLDKLDEIAALQAQVKSTRSSEKETSVAGPVLENLSDADFDFDLDFLQTDEAEEKKIFKTDVDEQIAADDMESHYNLGIAYREMGLYDDAISEFEKAEKDPSRFVDCQTLKGLCSSDKSDYGNAEKTFLQALDSSYLEDIQRLNLGYELGLLYERSERLNDALISYRNVLSQDSNYRDVSEKIELLKNQLGLADEDPDGHPGMNKERISFL